MTSFLLNLRILKLIILFNFAFISFCASSSHALENSKSRANKILVLHSFKAKQPWTMLFNRYLSEELGQDILAHYELNIEALDLLEFNDAYYSENLAKLLKYKYIKSQPDIIILTFPSAINFVLESKLFYNIPKILILPSESGYEDMPNSIVLPISFDFSGSIEHGIELFPDTEKVYVVAGNGDVDKYTVEMFSNDTKKLGSRIPINYLTELSINGLLKRIGNLPENSFVYYLSYSLDSSGKSIVARDFCNLLGKSSNRPVFTYLDLFALGTGILGGRVSTTKASASTSVNVIKKVFKGEAIDSLKPPKPFFKYVYDWKEIKRWGIDERKLSPNSIIQNRTYSFYELFKWKILFGFLILIAESLLVIFLFLNIKRKKAAEKILLDYSSNLEKKVNERTRELNDIVSNLEAALKEIKTLKGIIPICSICKKIRDDKGYWNILEAYIQKHSDAEFTHSICPKCVKEYYPGLDIYKDKD